MLYLPDISFNQMIKQTKQMLLAMALAVASPVIQAGELTVNDGSQTDNYVPFHFYYLDDARCKTQVVYPAAQLSEMAGSQIRQISFYLDDKGYSSDWATDNMALSLSECDDSINTDDDGYAEFKTGLKVVYSGHMQGERGGRFLTFELQQPYNYKGSNLLLQISLGTAGNAYPTASFLGVDQENYTAAYTTSGYTVYGARFLPKTSFTYGEQAQFEASVSASEINFPVTMVGRTSSATINVANTGVQPLQAAMTPPSGAFAATLPATEILSGETIQIPVTFTPTSSGAASGTIGLDLGEAGTFSVALNGIGMEMPAGVVTTFDVPDKSLPSGWTGWLVTDTFDYDVYDYVFAEAKEDSGYFSSFNKDETGSVSINFDNPFREYPNRHTVYMISPAVSGNVMMQLASDKSGESYGASAVTVYPATQTADGQWLISGTPLDFTWASEPADGWGVLIGNVAEASNLAVCLSSMAISQFAADNDESGSAGKDYSAVVTPETIDFGQVVAGRTGTKGIEVLNTGRKPFTITIGEISNPAFTATVEPATVEPAATATVTLTFAPEETGDFSMPLTLDMGEAGEATVQITAKAVGAVVGSEFTVDDITYVVTSQNETGVLGVSPELTEVTIPATVTNPDGIALDVVQIEREAFYWSNVSKAILPEGLRTIGYGAFRSSPLAEINLPSTLTSIGDYAFRTTNLTKVQIPDGVTALGSSVFASCEQLTEVKLPTNLTSIGNGAFYKTAITSIEIPETCLTIEDEAFELCASLSSIKLSSGLTEISPMLFLGCSSLTGLEIPASVTEIGTRAFEDAALSELHLPASVAKIASSTFNGAPVGEISVAPESTSFKVVDGALYDFSGDFLYLCPRTAAADAFTVQEGCKGIIGGAFYACPVKKVILPQSMIGIDEYAFCTSSLEQIELPADIFLIGTQAFAGTKLKEVVLPEALEAVSDGLFAACPLLESVTIPACTASIGNRAFYNCDSLAEIIALGETPAEFDMWEALTAPFLNVDCSKVTVYCPDGEEILSAYKASEWGDFFSSIKNISDRPESGVDLIGAAASATADVYTLQGQIVGRGMSLGNLADKLPAGVYIVRTPDGVCKISIR